MSAKVPMRITVHRDVRAQLEALARAENRSLNFVTERALIRWLALAAIPARPEYRVAKEPPLGETGE